MHDYFVQSDNGSGFTLIEDDQIIVRGSDISQLVDGIRAAQSNGTLKRGRLYVSLPTEDPVLRREGVLSPEEHEEFWKLYGTKP
ncbi:hypothetical protein J4416_02520 [Candidatus Pacearchaeota archaeon]|nr:hypothetical protein [Candidatus Pacearchaeota archaeon]